MGDHHRRHLRPTDCPEVLGAPTTARHEAHVPAPRRRNSPQAVSCRRSGHPQRLLGDVRGPPGPKTHMAPGPRADQVSVLRRHGRPWQPFGSQARDVEAGHVRHPDAAGAHRHGPAACGWSRQRAGGQQPPAQRPPVLALPPNSLRAKPIACQEPISAMRRRMRNRNATRSWPGGRPHCRSTALDAWGRTGLGPLAPLLSRPREYQDRSHSSHLQQRHGESRCDVAPCPQNEGQGVPVSNNCRPRCVDPRRGLQTQPA